MFASLRFPDGKSYNEIYLPPEEFGLEALLDEVEAASTFSGADVEVMMKMFGKIVEEKLSCGVPVDLGPLGTLRPKITAKSVATKEQCTAKTITSKGITYHPRAELTKALEGISRRVINSEVRGRKHKKKEE